MAIKLPVLHRARCTNLTVCGTLQSPGKNVVKRLGQPKMLVAKYGSGRSLSYVRVLHGGKSNTYMHVECATPGFFRKGALPEVSDRKETLMNLVEVARGLQVDASVAGCFAARLKELPETGIIRSMCTTKSSGSLIIELTGAELTVRGGPIDRLEWSVDSGTGTVRVWISADKQVRITPSYLVDELNWLRAQVDDFIFGKKDPAAE